MKNLKEIVLEIFKENPDALKINKKVNKIKVDFELHINNHWRWPADSREIVGKFIDAIEREVNEQLRESISINVDKVVIEKLAKELIDNYEFKPAIESAMHEKLKDYLKRI